MSSAPGPAEPRTLMRLRFVTEEEQQKLVAAWDQVTRRDDSKAMLREWFEAAGIDERYATVLWARSLRKLEICRADGTVDPDIARVLAAGMLTKLAGGTRRRPR